jgi:hypothetical protein
MFTNASREHVAAGRRFNRLSARAPAMDVVVRLARRSDIQRAAIASPPAPAQPTTMAAAQQLDSKMMKVFAVINIEDLHALGFGVFKNDFGYPGHAVIRPTAPMAIEVFGVRALRIPSFAIEVMSKRSTRALCYVIREKQKVVHSEAFTGVNQNWGWGEDEGEQGVVSATTGED